MKNVTVRSAIAPVRIDDVIVVTLTDEAYALLVDALNIGIEAIDRDDNWFVAAHLVDEVHHLAEAMQAVID